MLIALPKTSKPSLSVLLNFKSHPVSIHTHIKEPVVFNQKLIVPPKTALITCIMPFFFSMYLKICLVCQPVMGWCFYTG